MSKTRWAIVILLMVALFQVGSNAWAQVLADSNAQYMAPRYPSTLKGIKSVDDLMPYARILVQRKTSTRGTGFGVVKKGNAVMIVAGMDSDDMVLEALRRALEERGVKPYIFREYELVGVSKEDAEALEDAQRERRGPTAQQPVVQNGYMEGVGWVRNIGGGNEVAVKWLEKQNPDLYKKIFPDGGMVAPLSPHLREVASKLSGPNVGKAMVEFFRSHPEVQGDFWGGAIAFTQRNLAPMGDKHLGSMDYESRYQLANSITAFPDDLWVLEEQLVMEPLAFADKVTFSDPEGTNAGFDVTEEQAAKWANGAYIRGHIFLHPDQTGGRYPYSLVDFPAEQSKWSPIEPRVNLNGTIAGTIGHGGFYPHMETIYKDATLVDVKGGGLYGDILREFLFHYPGINTLTYPFMKIPGYFHLFEIATGTNPKYFRDPDNFVTPPLPWATGHDEIIRSGIFHLAIGAEMVAEPGSHGPPATFWKFADDNNLPRGHGWHIHNYFPTYKVHVRNTDRWITLVDKGHQTSLDASEVRALASRYGDPDKLLAEEWVPEIPGINAPGKYEDYAKDPYAYAKSVLDKVRAGTYEHFFPPIPGKQVASK